MFLCLGLCAGCDKNDPAPPSGPSTGENVTGNERFGWQQLAADAVELARIRYAVYIDGVRADLPDARCDQAATETGFSCSAPLPRLNNGSHLLELASFVIDGATVLEGARSAPLRVQVGARSLVTAASSADARQFVTVDGLAVWLEPVVEGLADPVDVAFTPDGRILVAQADATIHILAAGAQSGVSNPVGSQSIARVPSDRLLAIALDPAFRDTHHLFALLSTPPAEGAASTARTFLLARFREFEGRLIDRIVILDGVPAAAEPHGSLRFGPDGKLYVALDDGGAADRANDLASRNGKLLRLNPDGSTPEDQANLTPVFSYGFRAPHALTWQAASGGAWLADESAAGEPLLYALQRQTPRVRSRVAAAFRLPAGTTPAAALFYRGRVIAPFENNLFVASDAVNPLLRFTFDPADPLTIVSSEQLLDADAGPLTVMAQAPDGTLYVGTATALARLAVAAR